MRCLSAILLVSQASLAWATATAPAADTDLKATLANSVNFAGEDPWFKLEGAEASTADEFEKVVTLVQEYFEYKAPTTTVAKRVAVLNEMITFKEGADGQALYQQALKDIRNGVGAGTLTVNKVNYKALEVVYTIYLKDKMKSFISEHLLMEKCQIPQTDGERDGTTPDTKKGPSGLFFKKFLSKTITDEVAKTSCDASVMSSIVVKVQKTMDDAVTQKFEMNEATLEYVKEHPKSNASPLNPNSEYAERECYEAATKWIVGYIVKQQITGVCDPTAPVHPPSLSELVPTGYNGASPPILDDLLALDAHYGNTPPSLDDILLHQSRNQATPEYTLPSALPNTLPNTLPSTLPNTVSSDSPPSLSAILNSYEVSSSSGKSTWSTVIIGACGAALITVGVFYSYSRRVATSEE
jgi:hypothetical protein